LFGDYSPILSTQATQTATADALLSASRQQVRRTVGFGSASGPDGKPLSLA
jgi:hypothetical protein